MRDPIWNAVSAIAAVILLILTLRSHIPFHKATPRASMLVAVITFTASITFVFFGFVLQPSLEQLFIVLSHTGPLGEPYLAWLNIHRLEFLGKALIPGSVLAFVICRTDGRRKKIMLGGLSVVTALMICDFIYTAIGIGVGMMHTSSLLVSIPCNVIGGYIAAAFVTYVNLHATKITNE